MSLLESTLKIRVKGLTKELRRVKAYQDRFTESFKMALEECPSLESNRDTNNILIEKAYEMNAKFGLR